MQLYPFDTNQISIQKMGKSKNKNNIRDLIDSIRFYYIISNVNTYSNVTHKRQL